MIPVLAVNAVQYKMDLRESKLLGNYEYYYSAGYLKARLGLEVSRESLPQEIQEAVKGIAQKAPADKLRLAYLCSVMEEFLPTDKYDDQMKELFDLGEKDGERQKDDL